MREFGQTFFISDVHLAENHQKSTEKFIELLNYARRHGDALYILGDLFDVWIGDDYSPPFYQKIINALHTATSSGLPIYFLPGNRDFLIGKVFLESTKCTLLQEENPIKLYGQEVLLMHGDILCTLDVSYQKARKWLRNVYIQAFFLAVPLFLRKKIAAKMRNKSKVHIRAVAEDVMDVTPEAVEKVLDKHAISTLIHGHTHKPNIHTFTKDSQQCTRIVLGAWHDKPSVLRWEKSGQFRLEDTIG